MKPLIDADILLYEVGSCAHYVDEETNEPQIRNFEFVRELMDNKIEEICREVGATAPPRLFLTGKGNFREVVAVQKGYKANRAETTKPFHYNNLKGYLVAKYGAIIVDGMEADDAICIAQMENWDSLNESFGPPTIICSRDKDLRQCQGWSYSWECGKQPSWGPALVKGFGELVPTYFPEGHKREGKLKDLKGTGDKWFLTQLLMGDNVDNIPGLKGWGPVKVLGLLKDVDDYKEGLALVVEEYQNMYGCNWEDELIEQAQLVWMVRELNEDGSPKMWRLDDNTEA